MFRDAFLTRKLRLTDGSAWMTLDAYEDASSVDVSTSSWPHYIGNFVCGERLQLLSVSASYCFEMAAAANMGLVMAKNRCLQQRRVLQHQATVRLLAVEDLSMTFSRVATESRMHTQ